MAFLPYPVRVKGHTFNLLSKQTKNGEDRLDLTFKLSLRCVCVCVWGGDLKLVLTSNPLTEQNTTLLMNDTQDKTLTCSSHCPKFQTFMKNMKKKAKIVFVNFLLMV